LIYEKDGFYFYSVVREDGFNFRHWATRRAQKYSQTVQRNREKSNTAYNAAQKDKGFLSLGEPIKVGHHSERRHRKVIEQANNNMCKSIEADKAAEEARQRAEYWEIKAEQINLSMPESLEYYEHLYEAATAKHAAIKSGAMEKRHAYTLPYAKKAANEAKKKLNIAVKLWGDLNNE